MELLSDSYDVNTIHSMQGLLQSLNFPKDLKPLNKNERRWILQRCIYSILKQEDMRILNLARYKEFLKESKLRHNETNKALWLKTKDAKFKKMVIIPEKTFGVFTARMDEERLYRIQSECQDLLNRKQSPNLYVWGIRKRKV